MKPPPSNILMWNDLQSYPVMNARKGMSRGWRIFWTLAVLAVVVGGMMALSGVGTW